MLGLRRGSSAASPPQKSYRRASGRARPLQNACRCLQSFPIVNRGPTSAQSSLEPSRPRIWPVILSREEVGRLIESTRNLRGFSVSVPPQRSRPWPARLWRPAQHPRLCPPYMQPAPCPTAPLHQQGWTWPRQDRRSSLPAFAWKVHRPESSRQRQGAAGMPRGQSTHLLAT